MMKIMPDMPKSSISKHPEIIPIREMVDIAHKEYTESMNNDNKKTGKQLCRNSMIPMKE